MRDLVNACWFALKWGLLAALVAAVGVGFYFYTQLNDQIRVRVQAKLAACYPHLQVTVRSAQLIDGKGIEVRGLLISDPQIGGTEGELAYFDEMMLCCQTNWKELIRHEPVFTRIIVRHPQIQALRLADGTWTTSQLLPLPKLSDHSPDMSIENGQLIVVDPQRNPPTPFTVRDINLEIKPAAGNNSSASNASIVKGWLSADHVQRIEIAGRFQRGGAYDLSGSLAGIDVSPELMSVLPADQAARIAPLAPLRGQAKLDFHLRSDPTQPQQVQFAVKGQLAFRPLRRFPAAAGAGRHANRFPCRQPWRRHRQAFRPKRTYHNRAACANRRLPVRGAGDY